MDDNPKARAAMRAAVRDQIKSPDSPYVGEHFRRLRKEGYSEDDAIDLLAAVLVVEIWEMTNHGRSFDQNQYIERLQRLPDTSWIDEE